MEIKESKRSSLPVLFSPPPKNGLYIFFSIVCASFGFGHFIAFNNNKKEKNSLPDAFRFVRSGGGQKKKKK